ncbi:MAG: Gfo/Idh/MocA family oxidoreductase [Gemmatimonadetes bacterium]|nr:Gfo/Idh/MocA family oxidoreductase [Gemmatimonadota bacterium]
MTTDRTPTIAVIGAGAIADIFHLPALSRHPQVRSRMILVDRDGERARTAAAKHGITRYATDYRDVLPEIQGAVIAVPHRLHVPLSRDCVEHGVHVLCEKPLAETAAEAEELARAADQAGVTLSVNNTRRLYPSTRAVRKLIEDGGCGAVTTIDFEEGGAFEWPAVGDGYFGLKAGGRGVLSDVGAHVIDLVCWWLGGRPELERYEDDSFGGTEAMCEARLAVGPTRARVRLSWLGKLRNTYRVGFASGHAVEHGIYDWRNPTLIAPSGRRSTLKTAAGPATYAGFADVLLENFLSVVQGRATPLVPARAVIPSLSLIETCYARRTPFSMPWFDPAIAPPTSVHLEVNTQQTAEVA